MFEAWCAENGYVRCDTLGPPFDGLLGDGPADVALYGPADGSTETRQRVVRRWAVTLAHKLRELYLNEDVQGIAFGRALRAAREDRRLPATIEACCEASPWALRALYDAGCL